LAVQLPFNALHAFVVSAKHGSFSKAAEELHVTPAAISQQVRTLEEFLGVQLFNRLHRGLTLTDAGQTGLLQLQEGFENLSDAVQKIKTGNAEKALNIWTSPSFASKWLMPRMHRFREQHPHIDLRISGSASLIDSDVTAPSLSAQTLKSHNIDVAIRFGSGNYPGCMVDRFMEVDAITLCSPNLLSGSGSAKLTEPHDLENHTLLHDDSPYEGRPTWKSWLESAGLANLTCCHNLYFNSVQLALTAAIEGQGVVLTLEQLAQNDVDKGHLVRLFELPMEISQAYHIVSLDGAESDARVVAFKQWLLSEADTTTSPVNKST